MSTLLHSTVCTTTSFTSAAGQLLHRSLTSVRSQLRPTTCKHQSQHYSTYILATAPSHNHGSTRRYTSPAYATSRTARSSQASYSVHRAASSHAPSFTTAATSSATTSALPHTPPSRTFSTPTKTTRMRAAADAQRQFALHLYRAILAAHKIVLDPVMRDMGDTYVRDEFKRHKTAKPQYLQPFFEQWLHYLSVLKQQSDSGMTQGVGVELSDEQKIAFSEEQFKQLTELETESRKIDNLWVDALSAAELAERTGADVQAAVDELKKG